MRANRSIPNVTVIPELAYADVAAAADWLTKAFGFEVRLRIANHRIQMNIDGGGAIVVVELRGAAMDQAHAVMVRVANVDRHCEKARAGGACIAQEPATYPYGERQYSAEDIGGHRWKFTETVADVAPEEWGGTSVAL